MNTFHTPVVLGEVIAGLDVRAGKRYIDATVGGGGHGWEIVKRGGNLLGIDIDQEAIKFTKAKFKVQSSKSKVAGKWALVQGNFRDLEKIARENGFEKVDGILFDLGVSSYQLDIAERGFSYRASDAPLDLRFDRSHGESAAGLLNRASREELYEIFAKLAEEELAGPIADALISTRRLKPIMTTGDLARVIEAIVKDKRKQIKVLSRVFQGLRIAVNDELNALKEGLNAAARILRSGGRLAVISFHSLEDRIVKRFLRGTGWRVVTRKPVCPSQAEIIANPRSRSARLRIAEKI
ncbi:MAG: 16S rRNA (cytosine(1402)-N(4))-methyltransferase RsmH [Patescibacteria group bacterium]